MINTKALQLEEPSYILAINWPCRYLVMALLITCVLGGTSLLIHAYANGQFKNGYWFFIALIGFFAYFILLPSFWKPWVVFVADKNGFYLGRANTSHPYFIPWNRIGHTSVGNGGRGNLGNGPCVFFQWKLIEEDRRFLRARFLKEVHGESVRYCIGANYHDPSEIQRNIEKIRTQCGYVPAL